MNAEKRLAKLKARLDARSRWFALPPPASMAGRVGMHGDDFV